MTDQKTEENKKISCFGMMREMMRNMISGKGPSGCSCADMMTTMMPQCCAGLTGQKNPAEEKAQDAPK